MMSQDDGARSMKVLCSEYCIPGGILNPGLRKSLSSDDTTITPSACEVADRIVAAMSEVQWGAEPDAGSNDVGLRHVEQGGTDPQRSSFYTGLRSCSDGRFECTDEFRPAIRIAGIIQDIGPEIDNGRALGFSVGRSQREKNQVPAGHIGDRNPATPLLAATVFRNRHLSRQCGAAQRPQIHRKHRVFGHVHGGGHLTSPCHLDSMTLAV